MVVRSLSTFAAGFKAWRASARATISQRAIGGQRQPSSIMPSGAHKEWIHRYIDTASSDTTWDDLVADFVAAFQQQSSLDLLEAEWDAGLAARYKLCYCVLCEIY